MPSEAARFSRPVDARDRHVFAALALVAAAGTSAGVLLFGHGGGAAGAAGCFSYNQPGVMGGGTWHLCGEDATAFCRAHRDESTTLDARCDELNR